MITVCDEMWVYFDPWTVTMGRLGRG